MNLSYMNEKGGGRLCNDAEQFTHFENRYFKSPQIGGSNIHPLYIRSNFRGF